MITKLCVFGKHQTLNVLDARLDAMEFKVDERQTVRL